MWSFSADRIFKQCQRQWYFRNIVANARARDALRKEAYLLSKMQSIAAWRGQLVDTVISRYIIVALNENRSISKNSILKEARRLFDLQLEFAMAHRIRNLTIPPSKAGEAFAAFIPIEYNESVHQEELQKAWEEVELSITNLSSMDNVKAILKDASYRVVQRSLHLELGGANVRSVPDVILFSNACAPTIIDWKVQQFGRADYRVQLALYALCLSACKPHKDFPQARTFAVSEIKLLEVQLLTGFVREHQVTESDVDELESYIAASFLEISLACGEGKPSVCSPDEFMPAASPTTCRRCVFRKLCWEEPYGTHRD